MRHCATSLMPKPLFGTSTTPRDNKGGCITPADATKAAEGQRSAFIQDLGDKPWRLQLFRNPHSAEAGRKPPCSQRRTVISDLCAGSVNAGVSFACCLTTRPIPKRGNYLSTTASGTKSPSRQIGSLFDQASVVQHPERCRAKVGEPRQHLASQGCWACQLPSTRTSLSPSPRCRL